MKERKGKMRMVGASRVGTSRVGARLPTLWTGGLSRLSTGVVWGQGEAVKGCCSVAVRV